MSNRDSKLIFTLFQMQSMSISLVYPDAFSSYAIPIMLQNELSLTLSGEDCVKLKL